MSDLSSNVAELWLEVNFSASLKCYNDGEVDDNGNFIGVAMVKW